MRLNDGLCPTFSLTLTNCRNIWCIFNINNVISGYFYFLGMKNVLVSAQLHEEEESFRSMKPKYE